MLAPVSGDSEVMILNYHVTEQSWGEPKLRICWQEKEGRKKKSGREGQSRGGGGKMRGGGKDRRHLRARVVQKKSSSNPNQIYP